MERKAAVAVISILLLACSHPLPPLQTTALAGSPADLAKFEGRWFAEDDTLVAAIDSEGKPQFSFQIAMLSLEGLEDGHLETAEARHDAIACSIRKGRETHATFLYLMSSNEATIRCGCLGVHLHRDTSALWLVKLSARRSAKLAHTAYEEILDRLARVL